MINVLKFKLISASALTFLNYFKKVNMIIFIINISSNDWNVVLMQILKNLKQLKYIVRFESNI